ncbi:MAG: TIGR02147 family protein [Deltaproteobacteria bacterium]|nr:MAG: TIGR02147 family protein [Deltaproteobacteria bacterium]
MMTTRPHIFEYLNYRTFLRDLFQFKKDEKLGFSFRTFSRLAGLKSSNFLKLIIDGKRNLSADAIHKFAKAFKLTKEETQFFETLVHFDQAQSVEEKNFYYERVMRSKSYQDVRPLDASQYTYFSNWHFVALRAGDIEGFSRRSSVD